MIFHLGTQWLTFMAILQGSESVKEHQQIGASCIGINTNTVIVILYKYRTEP